MPTGRRARRGARRPASDYLFNLDALRGIAALAVVLFHVDVYSQLLASHVDSDFFRRAYLMVDLFFVLSGFVMSHVYGGWFDRGVHRGEAKRFIAARIARVYPLHLLTLLYLVGIVIVRYRLDPSAWQPQHAVVYSPAVLPQHVLLLHGMNTTPYASWNDPSWSISTEWWIYLVFPFLVRPLRDAGPLRVGLIVVTCLAIYLAIMFYLVPRVTVASSRCLRRGRPRRGTPSTSAYQYGFVAMRGGVRPRDARPQRAYAAGRWRSWLAGGAGVARAGDGRGVSMHCGLPDPVTVAFFPLLVLSAACGGRAVDAVLGARPLRRLGEWSYAIYMIHIPLMQTLFLLLMAGAIPQPTSEGQLGSLFLGYVVVTVVLSGLVHRLVERPLRDSVKRWLSPEPSAPRITGTLNRYRRIFAAAAHEHRGQALLKRFPLRLGLLAAVQILWKHPLDSAAGDCEPCAGHCGHNSRLQRHERGADQIRGASRCRSARDGVDAEPKSELSTVLLLGSRSEGPEVSHEVVRGRHPVRTW